MITADAMTETGIETGTEEGTAGAAGIGEEIGGMTETVTGTETVTVTETGKTRRLLLQAKKRKRL